MSARHMLDMLLLAALWGSSFLFMRIAVPEFGVAPLIELRVIIATLTLLPLMLLHHSWGALKGQWLPLGIAGLFNTALPFCLIAYALLTIPSGIGSILNATTPMFGALIAYLWLSERLTRARVLGLCIGFLGVALLVSDRIGIGEGYGLAIAASLLATCSYGFAANSVRKYGQGVKPLVMATGSQIIASLLLLPLALLFWPATQPSLSAWISVIILGIGPTGLAFILYFRLIGEIGAARTTTVTFLIPVFGMAAGVLFLNESLTFAMLVGTPVIVLGTALAAGIVKLDRLERKTATTDPTTGQ